MADKTPNRLINSSSPYLLQHAYNPVDWYPWADEALSRAQVEDKPILVSIGYSSCHWCHVMEKESFEDPEIAGIMNENFVCIKVDREERPDIDQIYMDAVQTLGSQGGWPLTVFLTPHKKPFYGGTYFPPSQFKSVLQKIIEVFGGQREPLNDSADQITHSISVPEPEKYGLTDDYPINKDKLPYIRNALASKFDTTYGGMKRSPKFPMPGTWNLVIYLAYILKDTECLNHAVFTLEKMAMGGIYDQIGGGFARYSTDQRWLAPHFEKMLYDNGQLMSLYASAYSLTSNTLFKDILQQSSEWLIREMTHPDGGFFSALDADSEGIEGQYYIWSSEEFDNVIGKRDENIRKYFGIRDEGNWENGSNILFNYKSLRDFVEEKGLNPTAFQNEVRIAKEKLMKVRNQREKPGRDEKILCSWNAMMNIGLIDAYNATGDQSFLQSALNNAEFLTSELIIGDKVFRVWKDGKAYIEGFLEDYSLLINMLLKLYQTTFDERWFNLAQKITITALEIFHDDQDPFLFFSEAKEDLVSRKKELLDNVIPSSNSVMAHNLYQLGLLTGNSEFMSRVNEMVSRMIPVIEKESEYSSNWGLLYAYLANPGVEIAISGKNCLEIRKEIASKYFPNKVISGTASTSEIPLLSGREANGNGTRIYVCRNHTCKQPVNSVSEAMKLILEES